MQGAVAMPAQPPYRLSMLIAELAPQVRFGGPGGVGGGGRVAIPVRLQPSY